MENYIAVRLPVETKNMIALNCINTGNNKQSLPPFIGNGYYCESVTSQFIASVVCY